MDLIDLHVPVIDLFIISYQFQIKTNRLFVFMENIQFDTIPGAKSVLDTLIDNSFES